MDAPLPIRLAGSLFPRGRELRVHSVFRSAVNLIGADHYPVALLARLEQCHPRGAVTDWPVDFSSLGLRQNDVVRLDFSSAQPSSEHMPNIPEQTDLAPALALLSRAQGTEAELSVRGLDAPDTALLRRFAEAIATMGGDFHKGARRLVGLGGGQTPAGDDFLVGWLAALSARGQPLPRLNGLKNGTSTISASFLDAAEQGLFPAALVGLAESLVSGKGTPDAIVCLAAIGHTSGLDAATGFLIGLQKLAQRRFL